MLQQMFEVMATRFNAAMQMITDQQHHQKLIIVADIRVYMKVCWLQGNQGHWEFPFGNFGNLPFQKIPGRNY